MDNEPLHILLADDDKGDRILFTEAFSRIKIRTIVHTVNDGEQLMEWLNMKNVRLPHFLFLDLNMPRKSGLECLKEIRSSEKLREIFVAIYSTSDNESEMEETFLQGANVYITKPSNFNVLKQTLEKAVLTAFQYQDTAMNKENFLLRIY